MNKNKTKKLLKNVLISGKHNSYRPHLTRYYGMAIFLVIIFSLSLALNLQKPNVKGANTDISVDSIRTAINFARSQKGLAVLKLDQNLSLAAAKKAEDIFDKQYWDHKSPTGKTAWSFMGENGYNYSLGGENLAKDYSYSRDVTEAWLGSIKHRDNLLNNNYRDLGVAIKQGKLSGRDTEVIVTLYGTRRGEEVAGANTDNFISKYSSLLLDKIGFYTNPISPILLLIFAFIGLYSVVAFISHIKIGKVKVLKQKNKMQKSNAYRLGIIVIGIIGFNVFLSLFLPKL